MSDPHSMESILDDETLAPLKRNSACLQCKRRKVKCDAVKPTCNPCLRSHAHALRSASRNGTTPPELCCTYGDADESDHSPAREPESAPFGAPRKDIGERKRTPAIKKLDKSLEREKERRKDEEKENLLSRIAELEERLSKATQSSSTSGNSPFTPESLDASRRAQPVFQATQQAPYVSGGSPARPHSTTNYARQAHIITDATDDVSFGTAGIQKNQMPGIGDLADLGLADLFMIPFKWPQNLPAPFLLEHLMDTFFASCPYDARMVHRPTLMNRIRKSPTDPDFPHASLLHAICAVGALYTAWVPSVAPHMLEETIENHNASGAPLESIADFSLAQAEASRRTINTAANVCGFGPGRALFDILQAHSLLADVYMRKGLPMQAWMVAGQPARLVKILEIATRRAAKRYKDPVLPTHDNVSAIEREERRATVWQGFILDAIFGLNSSWGGSFKLSEIHCNLPTSQEQWRNKGDLMLENPQSAHDPDVYINHPVVDSFVLLCKAAILASRVNSWLDSWNQREVIVDGDDMDGIRMPDFCQLQNDIRAFQASTSLVTREMLKVDDGFGGQSAILDPNLLMVHIFPNVALICLYEPFIRREPSSNQPAMVVQQALEAVVSVLHMIPSNLELSKLFNSMIVFSILTSGRLIIDAMQHAVEQMNFGMAIKLQSDLTVVMSLIERNASHSAIALHMKQFLETYLKSNASQRLAIKGNCSRMEETRSAATMRSGASDAFPPGSKLTPNDSGTSSTGMSPYLDMSGSSSADQTSPESAAEAFGYLQSDANLAQLPVLQDLKHPRDAGGWSYAASVSVEELDPIGWRTGALCG